ELNETPKSTEQSNEEPLSLANPKQQEQNITKDDMHMALEETDLSYPQNLQLPVSAKLATTNNSSDEQMQVTTQEDLLPHTEMLPRDEFTIYGYGTPYPSASRIPKAAFSSNKNKETDGFITVINKKNKKGNRTSKKDETRSSLYKKTYREASYSQFKESNNLI
ncbi:990_t:CDS:1, partial [Cetraspora pellucida]